MSVGEPMVAEPEAAPRPAPKAAGRPLRKRAMHLVRRGHLYLGLFLFPWAILYGVTAFLFNHPTAFSDQPTTTFGREVLAGTPLETPPAPGELAAAVVAKLNEAQKPAVPYTVAGDAKYTRDTAAASVKADGHTVTVFVNLKTGGGTVRSAPVRERKEPEKAPFAVGTAAAAGRGRGAAPAGKGGPRGGASGAGVRLDSLLPERIRAAVPTVLERTGFPTGEVTVTGVPDVVFPVEAGGRTWTATYNPLTGAVSGVPEGQKPEAELGWRRFLLRLHTAHGYPRRDQRPVALGAGRGCDGVHHVLLGSVRAGHVVADQGDPEARAARPGAHRRRRDRPRVRHARRDDRVIPGRVDSLPSVAGLSFATH